VRKNYNLKVILQTGTEFLVKVGVDNVGELCAWLAGMESVREYEIVGSVTPKAPHSRHENGIAAARLEKGWTQQELADAIGVAQQHIQRWEAGVYKPKTETLKRIGEALGVEWSTLVED
jgi:DNA-binding XRE family transcriptional regulator